MSCHRTSSLPAGLAPALLTAIAVGLAAPLATPAPALAQDLDDVRMVADPGTGAGRLAFHYDGDLWLATSDGSDARRLTTHDGMELSPRVSPDGRWIAFSGEYDGNTDVYIVPAEGGAPRRLTWHPGPDHVLDWTPDGARVLFRSQRAVHTNRHTQLFTVSTDGGMPDRLPIPFAATATFSPDGRRIAYTPLSDASAQWKNYRGGRTSRIWLYDRDDHEVTEVPQPPERSNDLDPVWLGGTVYFRSDRDGEYNLYGYDVASGEVRRLTDHQDFPILGLDGADGVITYEQAGYLHRYDTATGQTRRLRLSLTSDLNETRPRYVSGSEWLRNFDVSPTGARAVFEYRGEIVTVPADKGDVRHLTRSSGAHERSPAWSPDGSRIAWFSDASGEYELVVARQDGTGEPRRYRLDGAGFYEDPKWSPDGSRISYTDNSWSLWILDLDSGRTTRVAQEQIYGPEKTLHHAWSPDSRWLAYTLNTRTYFQRVHLYSLDSGRSTAITDGLADVAEPVFDAGGDYLYFFASTDAGPVRQWFAQSNADMEMSGTLYLAVLPEGVESPLKAESDEEPVAGEIEEEDAQEEGAGATAADEVALEVDFEDLAQRIVTLPVGTGRFRSLQPGEEGQLYYLRDDGEGWSLRRFGLSDREEQTLLSDVSGYRLARGNEKVLARVNGDWLIGGVASGTVDPSEGRLATDDIEVRIEPRAEWAQMLREAWRINRDYFYDPGMHGADWPAIWDRYEPFLEHVVTRNDLNRVIRWMLSELAVGHSYSGGGDFPEEAEDVPGGLLGADYTVEDNRYRFDRVYGGLNWNPELRSPLTQPGVDVEEGEYLLAVEGRELRPPENVYSRFENTAGKQVRITVGPRPDGRGSRTVTVVPIESDLALRNRAWVEGNIEKVHQATDGRVAYIYVPNTAGAGHEYFKRYFFPQAHMDAAIIDERYNGGGQVADYYIDLLRRPHSAHWNMRYGDDIRTPIAAITGPKVMIIDETAGSGGDLLPWMFREFDMGPLVGRRTWGGLVGVLGFPPLIDGGSVTAPNVAIWTEDGFIVENQGVPPDIEVEQLPALMQNGEDPQLRAAIDAALRLLRENPPPTYERPPYPVRVRQQP